MSSIKQTLSPIKVKTRSYISEEDESSSAGEGEEIVTKVSQSSHMIIILDEISPGAASQEV